MNRRVFLRSAACAAVMNATFSQAEKSSSKSSVTWPVGAFDRPWVKWDVETRLRGIREAGFPIVGLLTKSKEEPFVASEATPEYLDGLRKKIAASGLQAHMAAIRVPNALPLAEQIKDVRQQLENARFLGLEFVLTFGVDQPAHYESYYKVMADAAAFARERAIKLVIKPHGGGSGAAEEILRCLRQVNHPNFKVWYDAGNIIYYTGKDPLEQLKPIAEHVTGFCAKDCATTKGDVFIQFGEGKVNFLAVFQELKRAGFKGPVMLECCKLGDTPEAVTANAQANREYLEKILASL